MTGRLLRNGELCLNNVAYAAGFMSRGRGWLGYERTALQGVWLPATAAVHTWGMRMALDLIWLDQNDYCCKVDKAVPAWRVRYHARAKSVLELRCGLITNAEGVHFSWTE